MSLFQLDKCDSCERPLCTREGRGGRAYFASMYVYSFKLRNPIAYLLWYRWWFRRQLTSKDRDLVWTKKRRAESDDCLHKLYGLSPSYWEEFCLWHPWLFLPIAVFQLLKQLVTAPVQVVGAAEGEVVCSQTAVNPVVDEKFTGEQQNVPKDEVSVAR